MSPAAAELSGLDKPACPQPHSWSPGCSRHRKERTQRVRPHRSRSSSRNKEQRCWLLLGAAEALEEQRWAWPKPCPCCSCRAKLCWDGLEGSREGPVEAEGAAALEVLLFPLPCHVSQEQQSVPGLCSALLPLLQRTVSICFGSALEAAPGSSSDETCLGKPLPWEGWGYPAQAAFWNSSSPGCSPLVPSKPVLTTL